MSNAPAKIKRSQAERTAATRLALIESAKALFAERGYANVNTEHLVEACGVTRGALYHHFGSKIGLFEAVVESVQEEVAHAIEQEASRESDHWSGIKKGCVTFVRVCTQDNIRQILLVDAISVLGFDRWREIDTRHSMASLQAGLEECIKSGVLPEQPVEPLARLLSGAVNEASLWLAEAPYSQSRKKQIYSALNHMLEALVAKYPNVK
ncbi:MAG TPA: TetR/AcrR family transcriptional regulator [Phycisphaerales bacterium]|nr:TetR/AcrR family transcriptional regulator [Phycisphaerales bacterium]